MLGSATGGGGVHQKGILLQETPLKDHHQLLQRL